MANKTGIEFGGTNRVVTRIDSIVVNYPSSTVDEVMISGTCYQCCDKGPMRMLMESIDVLLDSLKCNSMKMYLIDSICQCINQFGEGSIT